MGGDFLPGKPQFWVSFSVPLPLLLVALVFALTPQRIRYSRILET